MKKTPTIFKRDPENMKAILPVENPSAAWVFKGEGVATRKYDGTCCLISGGNYFKRREIKDGSYVPAGFLLADHDDVTGKTVGWVPVDATDKYHMEAFRAYLADGTYELCGPKVQGNPEKYDCHTLIRHETAEQYKDCPRDFDGIKNFMDSMDIEGIVFHHPDGRMAKIKKRDFGQRRVPGA